MEDRSPIGGGLDGPHVFGGFVGIGPDEVKVETANGEGECLFSKDYFLLGGRGCCAMVVMMREREKLR